MKFNLDTASINYIKIKYTDKNETSHFLKAGVKTINEREITACAKSSSVLDLELPQNVQVNFACENGLYEADAVLKFADYEDPYVFLVIKTPEDVEFKQSREYFRVKLDGDVILTSENLTFSSKIYDISANGIRITLNKEVSFPDEVEIEILFPPNGLKTKAEYVRTDNEDGILKASFRFVDLDEHVRDIISQKCIQKQLEIKRNSLNN